jgi:hypothetical protein
MLKSIFVAPFILLSNQCSIIDQETESMLFRLVLIYDVSDFFLYTRPIRHRPGRMRILGLTCIDAAPTSS